ncbi:MAG: Gp138 family membrane-puncturing spike protein [Rouxiella badensis]|uniref:Gp138 family membrane-puncturing spike protein n=1 Tax=Rouxiella badensis TaxID=1646377 RepID=UPI003C62A566
MPVSLNSQVGSREHLDAALAEDISSALRVAMPGIIQSFDPETVTCTVQPAVRGTTTDTEGVSQSTPLPLLLDVPVVFPRGGGVTMTFPIKAGDECLLIFGDRGFDFWWQSGGVQEPVDDRQHDLADAFAIIGPQSQAQKINNVSTDSVQLRSDDGATSLSLNPTAGTIAGVAPGGFDLNGLKISRSGQLTLVDGSVVDGHTHGGVEQGGSKTEPLSP